MDTNAHVLTQREFQHQRDCAKNSGKLLFSDFRRVSDMDTNAHMLEKRFKSQWPPHLHEFRLTCSGSKCLQRELRSTFHLDKYLKWSKKEIAERFPLYVRVKEARTLSCKIYSTSAVLPAGNMTRQALVWPPAIAQFPQRHKKVVLRASG